METIHLTVYAKTLGKQLSFCYAPRQDVIGVYPQIRRGWVRIPPRTKQWCFRFEKNIHWIWRLLVRLLIATTTTETSVSHIGLNILFRRKGLDAAYNMTIASPGQARILQGDTDTYPVAQTRKGKLATWLSGLGKFTMGPLWNIIKCIF